MDIINKINKVIKEKHNNIYKILDKKSKYLIKYNKQGDKKYIDLMKNDKKVITGTFRLLGTYNQTTNLWMWASSLSNSDIKTIKKINKLKYYQYLFESSTDPKAIFYYQLLTQDVINITNNEMLDWINHLLIYLTDDLYFFNPIQGMNIQFITLKKIKQKFV